LEKRRPEIKKWLDERNDEWMKERRNNRKKTKKGMNGKKK